METEGLISLNFTLSPTVSPRFHNRFHPPKTGGSDTSDRFDALIQRERREPFCLTLPSLESIDKREEKELDGIAPLAPVEDPQDDLSFDT